MSRKHRQTKEGKRKKALQREFFRRLKASGQKFKTGVPLGVQMCDLLDIPHTTSKAALYYALETMFETPSVVVTTVPIKPIKIKRHCNLTPAFYLNDAWLVLRYKVLVEYGRVCMCCGGEDRIHVDHIQPRSAFPELALEFNNLQVLCRSCNLGKMALDSTDWRPIWAKRVYPLPLALRPVPNLLATVGSL